MAIPLTNIRSITTVKPCEDLGPSHASCWYQWFQQFILSTGEQYGIKLRHSFKYLEDYSPWRRSWKYN